MSYAGNFCPRCGLPAGGTAYGPAPYGRAPPSGSRTALSVLWTLAIAGVLVLVVFNVSALLISPTLIWPGIQGVSQGQTTNQGLDAGNANWTFLDPTGSGSTGTYVASGGNPGGYLQVNLPTGPSVGGLWEQAVRVTGSTPFLAGIQLDLEVQSSGLGPQGGQLVVGIESNPQGLPAASASAVLHYNGTMGWRTTPLIDLSDAITTPGTYYLKVAFLAASNPSPALVGFDNLRLEWTTNAYFWIAAPLPVAIPMYLTQDPAQMAAGYVFVVATLLISVGYCAYRDRRLLPRTLRAPLDAIGSRLRSMSTWVAVAQAWLAVTFFQYAVIFVMSLAGLPATTPVDTSAANTWFLLYDLARASVFEELAFRMILIGVPMMAVALLARLAKSTPGGGSRSGGSPLRQLLGGALRADSPREQLVAGWILLFVSSAVFGMAHAAGWGDWKVLPAAVAGLAFGYLFLRHGIAAAIVAHFLNDYLSAIVLENIGGLALEAALSLLLLALIVAGAGFFVWYILYAWRHLQDLVHGHRARVVRQPILAVGPAAPPGTWDQSPPSLRVSGPTYPYAPPPPPPPYYSPPPSSSPPPPQGWSPPPPAVRAPPRGSLQLPQGYAPTYHPPPYGYPPVRFQCPHCGWVEARYENHVFTCLRCGRPA